MATLLTQKLAIFTDLCGLRTRPEGYSSVVVMKVDCKTFRGIEYVQFCDLPKHQQEVLYQTAGESYFIKIMVDGKIISQCIQYKDYSSWYDSTYREAKAPNTLENKPAINTIEVNPNLALHKA